MVKNGGDMNMLGVQLSSNPFSDKAGIGNLLPALNLVSSDLCKPMIVSFREQVIGQYAWLVMHDTRLVVANPENNRYYQEKEQHAH